jgi:hypothetical protein
MDFLRNFIRSFGGIIKADFLPLFADLHREALGLYSLNFGIIMLIPKIHNATKIQQYRLICVLNVSFKIFTKVGTNRLNLVAKKVMSPTQSAFMPGRNIMEGVVILHETIHELHTKKRDGVILKLILKRLMTRLNGPFYNKPFV